MPLSVQQTVNTNFAGYKVNEAAQLEDAKHGKCYEVELWNGKDRYEVLLSPAGEILSKEADKEEKD